MSAALGGLRGRAKLSKARKNAIGNQHAANVPRDPRDTAPRALRRCIKSRML
jgi:hypothetical protein